MFSLRDLFPKPRSSHATIRRIRSLTAISSVVCTFLFISTNRQLESARNILEFSKSQPVFNEIASAICPANLKVTRILLVLRVNAAYSDTRQYVREKIWNSPNCSVGAVFLYGKFLGSKAAKWQNMIDRENASHSDVVQIPSISDYQLTGQRAVDSVKTWLTADPCVVYQQVAFGTFQLPAETIYHGEKSLLQHTQNCPPRVTFYFS
jgi:hypothetical protein